VDTENHGSKARCDVWIGVQRRGPSPRSRFATVWIRSGFDCDRPEKNLSRIALVRRGGEDLAGFRNRGDAEALAQLPVNLSECLQVPRCCVGELAEDGQHA